MDIKNGDQYITLDISLKFGNMGNIKITSSEPKYYLGISDKWLIHSLGINNIRRLTKIRKTNFAITEVIIKDISKIIKEFKDVPY